MTSVLFRDADEAAARPHRWIDAFAVRREVVLPPGDENAGPEARAENR